MLRVCVIGLGHIGNLHATIYKEDEMVELVGVCDLIEERAKAASERLGVPYWLDAPTMLREVKPDLVSVATGGYEYSSDHCLPTIQALEAGCHVLCEKPISNSIEDGRRMVAAAKKNDRCFALDFNHRFTPAARTAKKWQNEGRIGDLLFCNMALWIGKPQPLESPYYHLKALNPHSCEIIRYFMGDVEAVQCFAMMAPGRNIWSTASINMKFKCGAVGHLTSSYDIARGHPMERCEVAGLKGRLVFEDMWREATLYPAGDPVKLVYTNPVFGGYSNFDDTFRERIRCFVREVAAGTRPEDIDGSGLQGLKAQMIIHAAIESLDTGRVVYLEEMFPDVYA
ncbi:MAG: Gfo/Idh/MocA family oxidoreductase [Clostridia bacterium]|nr:Gfo/Idh/MocA family oxidoreductase [Clostridia bacterium]